MKFWVFVSTQQKDGGNILPAREILQTEVLSHREGERLVRTSEAADVRIEPGTMRSRRRLDIKREFYY